MHRSISAELSAAEFKLGLLLAKESYPTVLEVGITALPSTCQALIYLYISHLSGLSTGAATLGVAGLAMIRQVSSDIGDLVDADYWDGTDGAFKSAAPVGLHYLTRSIPFWPMALFAPAAVTLACVGFAHLAMTARLLLAVLLLLPALASMTGFVLTLSTLSIGRPTQNLIMNLASSLLAVASGALFDPGRYWWLAFGEILPLRHSASAARLYYSGRSCIPEIALELAVSAFWLSAAIIAFECVRRDRARR